MSNKYKLLELFYKYRYGISENPNNLHIGSGIPDKKLNNAIKSFAQGADKKTVIALYDTSVLGSGKTGYLFTETKLYFVEAFGKAKKIWYDDIYNMEVLKMDKKRDTDRELLIILKDEPNITIVDMFWKKTVLCSLLDDIKSIITPKPYDDAVKVKYSTQNDFGAFAGGWVEANRNMVNKLCNEEKFHAHQGHGYAAEQANDFHDRMHFKNAKIVGNDNVKNGPDRVVNDVIIQSKYCKTGAECIKACFDQNGEFRYWNADNSPMQIEVPKDKYEDALREMQSHIRNGEVKGVHNPEEAENFVRKGNVTYEQAKNIAKAGNIDSLRYDAANGAVICASAFGITAVVTLATNLWNGEDFDVSLKNAAWSGLKVGGTAFVTSIVASQLAKAGLNSALVGSSEAMIGVLGPKASAVLINAFRSGSNIYGGAAMKSAAKLIRNNTITVAVTIVLLTSVDIANIFKGRISGKQLFKNMVNNASTIAGGSGGFLGGAAIGSTILPGAGTIVGGIIGSVAAGSAAGGVSNKITHKFIEDDAEAMVAIIQKRFERLADEYLLNQKEAEKSVDKLGNRLKGSTLKDMYASQNYNLYADTILRPIIEEEIKKRKPVSDIKTEDMLWAIKGILEEIDA